MRENLFRGLDKHYNKEVGHGYNVWRFGSLIEYDNGQVAIVASADRYGRGMFTNEVIPETVGQYTGLDDKNNRKIFEGDILTLKYPRDRRYKVIAKVINGQEISAMVLKFDNDFTTEEFPLYKISAENNLEVIGNIHDNPELMENDTD